MKQVLFIFFILELTLPRNARAAETAYQWTDNQGQIHYGDKLPVSIESRTITLQRDTIRPGSHPGLRPGERDRLSKLEQHQQQQQRRAHTARIRTDRQREIMQARCMDNREMLKNSRGRDTFKKYSRYLRNNCW